jgi:signal transduction histidine kinase
MEQHVLRIAQEAVTNAVKHAKAKIVSIELEGEEQLLPLRIKDDGIGFEPPRAFSVFGGHFGILGMQARAKRLRAEFILASSPGAGTQVEVRIPFVANHSKKH